METIKIKSTDQANQGDYVIINKDDYDSEKHELFEDSDTAHKTSGLTVAQIKEQLVEKGIEIPDGITKKADLLALLPQE